MTIDKAREILGESANKMSDQEILSTIALFQNMCESWLDSFETQTFGTTISRLLTTREGTRVK